MLKIRKHSEYACTFAGLPLSQLYPTLPEAEPDSSTPTRYTNLASVPFKCTLFQCAREERKQLHNFARYGALLRVRWISLREGTHERNLCKAFFQEKGATKTPPLLAAEPSWPLTLPICRGTADDCFAKAPAFKYG